MALIKCRECGKEISASAERCTNCGSQTTMGKIAAQSKGVKIALIISTVAFILGLFLIYSNVGTVIEKFDNERYWKYDDEASAVLYQFATGIGMVIGSCIGDVICYKKAKELAEAERQQQLISRLVDQPHYHYHSSPPITDRPSINSEK